MHSRSKSAYPVISLNSVASKARMDSVWTLPRAASWEMQRSFYLLFLSAECKHSVPSPRGPELAFHFHSRLFGSLYERSPAIAAFSDAADTLTRETNQGHISRHNFSFGLFWF